MTRPEDTWTDNLDAAAAFEAQHTVPDDDRPDPWEYADLGGEW